MISPAGKKYGCLFLEMAATIEFYYISPSNEIEKAEYNIPPDASSSGYCGNSGSHKQIIQLSWYSLQYINVLEFTFRKNDHIYEINKIVLNITKVEFTDIIFNKGQFFFYFSYELNPKVYFCGFQEMRC